MFNLVAASAVLLLAWHMWRTRNGRWAELLGVGRLPGFGRVGEFAFKTLPPLFLLLFGLALLVGGVLQLF